MCAGSLLGIKLSHTSFPVGKVEYLEMYPMTFTEFLLADNQENLVQYMESITKIEKIPDIIFKQLNEKVQNKLNEKGANQKSVPTMLRIFNTILFFVAIFMKMEKLAKKLVILKYNKSLRKSIEVFLSL